MSKPKMYLKRPERVQAMQFRLGYALSICDWADGVYLVPQGYEHPLRPDGEKDRSRGDTLDDAPPFLVVKTKAGNLRASLLDWVARLEDDTFTVVPQRRFEEEFNLEEGALDI